MIFGALRTGFNLLIRQADDDIGFRQDLLNPVLRADFVRCHAGVAQFKQQPFTSDVHGWLLGMHTIPEADLAGALIELRAFGSDDHRLQALIFRGGTGGLQRGPGVVGNDQNIGGFTPQKAAAFEG